jgi:hypothetical protein
MKRKTHAILHTLSILFSVFFSCQNQEPPNQKKNTTINQVQSFKEDFLKVDSLINLSENPSQFFTISCTKKATIVGKKGTILHVEPNNLETENGSVIKDSITIELKELHNQKDLAISNAQTISEGKLLESGGAYYIAMKSGGQRLRIKKDKTLKVEFPRISVKEMSLFYGERDSLGNINWNTTENQFENDTMPIAKTNSKIVALPERLLVIEFDKSKRVIMSESEYLQSKRTGEFVNSRIIDRFSGDQGGPMKKNEEKEYLKEEENQRINGRVYKAIELNKLGWINCDRFNDEAEKTDLKLTFSSSENIQSAVVLLIFKDINSVMKNYYVSSPQSNSSLFANIPVGQKVKLIGISLKNLETYTYTSEFTITPNQTLNIHPEKNNSQDLAKLFDFN